MTSMLMICFWAFNHLLSLPFSYWDTFHVEERFGFNNYTRSLFFYDKAKEYFLTGLIGVAIYTAVYHLFLSTDMAWVIVFFIIAAFNALYGFIFPVIILPLFFNLTPLGQCNLRTMIEEVKQDFIISIEYYHYNEISKTDQFPARNRGVKRSKNGKSAK